MNKRARQYIGLFSAILAYYIVHEGAHLIYALLAGAFKEIKLLGIGVQIDIYADRMTELELGMFCIVGSVTTFVIGYILVFIADKVCALSYKLIRACVYYITIAMLFIDPLYLSVLCGFFGGGDMNGISLIIPELVARIAYGIVLVINVSVFIKVVLPKYKASFSSQQHSL